MSNPPPIAFAAKVDGAALSPRSPKAGAGWLAWSVVVPAIVLVTAIAVQGVHIFRQVHQGIAPHLAHDLPMNPEGWVGTDKPLGANEFLSDTAEKVLNYDDFVYRSYSHPGEAFEVYVAYWAAGKMPTRMVASHTPDRCWTENGWQCLQMKFKQPESLGQVELKPAEWREFQPPSGGKATYVLYWHLVDGHLYDYGGRFNAVPDPMLWWKDAVQQAILGSREQYFIRINSQEPLETLWNDPGFREVLKTLERYGLAAAPLRP